MRRVAQIMGLPVSIDIPGAADDAPHLAAFALLRNIDKRFSPCKKRSELSRYRTGQLSKDALSTDMQAAMQACKELEVRTDGYFSAYFDGQFDPTGYVKGWAIQQASELLKYLGHHTHMINAGGDIQARSRGGHLWRIGLQHPTDPQAIMGTIAGGNLAVATSATYARGQHIINPHTGQPAAELLSVTVTGPDIVTADALATAAFAMDYKSLAFMETQDGYEAFIVGQHLDAYMTSGFASQDPTMPVRTRSAR